LLRPPEAESQGRTKARAQHAVPPLAVAGVTTLILWADILVCTEKNYTLRSIILKKLELFMESIFEPKDTHKFEVILDNQDFVSFMASNLKGILCVPENVTEQTPHSLVMPETYRFAKWMKKNSNIVVEVAKADGVKSLHSFDFWMPIVFLASDVTLPIYLGVVSNYIYDCLRGALKHDRADVHIEAYYKDSHEEHIRKFSYSGSIEGLKKITKSIDLNKFVN
jgi:hypothetical protein